MIEWTDQPDELRCSHILLSVLINSNTFEVRKPLEGSYYYLTAGTLFGSQTVKCETADIVFSLLNVVNNSKKPLEKLPLGVTPMN